MYILISYLITSVSVVKSHIWLSPCEVGEIHWVQFLSTARLGQGQAAAWGQLAPVFLLSTEKHQLIFSVVRAGMWKDEQTCAWLLRLETSQCQFHPHCMDQNVPLSKPHMRGLGGLGVWLSLLQKGMKSVEQQSDLLQCALSVSYYVQVSSTL